MFKNSWFEKIVKKAQYGFFKKAQRWWEGGWKYEVPSTGPELSTHQRKENIQQRMYDFYFLEVINPDAIRNSPWFGKGFGDEENSEKAWNKAIENIKMAKSVLVEAMKNEWVECFA